MACWTDTRNKSYSIILQDGRVMKRHVDQIRSRTVQIDKQPEDARHSTTSEPGDTQPGTPPLRHSTRVRSLCS